MKPEGALNSFASVTGFGANTPSGSGFKQIPHSQSHHFVIVYNQDSDTGFRRLGVQRLCIHSLNCQPSENQYSTATVCNICRAASFRLARGLAIKASRLLSPICKSSACGSGSQ